PVISIFVTADMSASVFSPTRRSTLFPSTTLFRSSTGRQRISPPNFAYTLAMTQILLPTRIYPNDDANTCHKHFYSRKPHCHQLEDRKSTRLNSSHVKISYAVFCLKKKTPTYYSVS